jgi:hypothetical protein
MTIQITFKLEDHAATKQSNKKVGYQNEPIPGYIHRQTDRQTVI